MNAPTSPRSHGTNWHAGSCSQSFPLCTRHMLKCTSGSCAMATSSHGPLLHIARCQTWAWRGFLQIKGHSFGKANTNTSQISTKSLTWANLWNEEPLVGSGVGRPLPFKHADGNATTLIDQHRCLQLRLSQSTLSWYVARMQSPHFHAGFGENMPHHHLPRKESRAQGERDHHTTSETTCGPNRFVPNVGLAFCQSLRITLALRIPS